MTGKSHLSIVASVAESERAAMNLAAGHLAQSLSQAAGVPWTCVCTFNLPGPPATGDTAIIVTSFLPELEKIAEPWPQTEQRLRAAYTALAAGGIPVFICTVLRHVGPDIETEFADALLIRIRRLNLLAAEISRETCVFVIDLDRVLADIGARRLQTDHRLTGDAAATAGHFIALTLITNGLDAVAPFELQDAARALLAASPPAIAELDGAKPGITLRKGLMAMGQGKRKQIVSPVLHTVEENYIGWLTRQILQGRIGPREALQRFISAVRRRGVRESAALLASGLSKQISRKK
jgi:hypothetical protein